MEVVMHIARLSPCSCGAHTLVHLEEVGADRRARLRVSLDTGRCLLAEGAELPNAGGVMVRALVECLRQLDVVPEALLLERTSETLGSSLRCSSPRQVETLRVEPDAGLLLAARQRLPIVLIEGVAEAPAEDNRSDDSVESELPGVFRDFLSTLRFEPDQ